MTRKRKPIPKSTHFETCNITVLLDPLFTAASLLSNNYSFGLLFSCRDLKLPYHGVLFSNITNAVFTYKGLKVTWFYFIDRSSVLRFLKRRVIMQRQLQLQFVTNAFRFMLVHIYCFIVPPWYYIQIAMLWLHNLNPMAQLFLFKYVLLLGVLLCCWYKQVYYHSLHKIWSLIVTSGFWALHPTAPT